MNNSNLYRTLFLLDDTRNFTNDFTDSGAGRVRLRFSL